LIDNKPTKFHQSHSVGLEMKHKKSWTLHAHYTFFSWTSRAHNSEIMYKIKVLLKYFLDIYHVISYHLLQTTVLWLDLF